MLVALAALLLAWILVPGCAAEVDGYRLADATRPPIEWPWWRDAGGAPADAGPADARPADAGLVDARPADAATDL